MAIRQVSVQTETGSSPFNAHLLGEQGAWVVCWPGQINDHISMLAFAEQLAKKHRVVIVDPPAAGSNRHLPYSAHIEDHLPLALALLRSLRIERCHWVGQAGGGVMGAAVAVASPTRLITLTLVSTPMLSQGRFSMSEAAIKTFLSSFRFGRRFLVKRSVEQLGYGSPKEKKIITDYFLGVFERTASSTINDMRPLPSASVRSIFDKLCSNHPPLMILCGKHDRAVLPRNQRTVAELTQSSFVEINSGHLALMAKPERCVQAFVQFTQRLSTA
jgi:pimeloyl-ACP methyl ester carboxylesterase